MDKQSEDQRRAAQAQRTLALRETENTPLFLELITVEYLCHCGAVHRCPNANLILHYPTKTKAIWETVEVKRYYYLPHKHRLLHRELAACEKCFGGLTVEETGSLQAVSSSIPVAAGASNPSTEEGEGVVSPPKHFAGQRNA